MNEVATFVNNVIQFEWGESTGQCVAFCAAQIIKATPPGRANPHTHDDIDSLAEEIYRVATGQIRDPIAMNPEQLKDALGSHGIRFEGILHGKADINASLSSGCPVVVMGVERTFVNLDGSSPYAWDTMGIYHAIILSGLHGDNGYLVRDSANSGGNPAIYDKHRMELFSAIRIVPAWIGEHMVPSGWKDDPDNKILTASNLRKVPGVWREYILTHPWDEHDVPIEDGREVDPVEEYWEQQPSGGARMLFNYTELGWTSARGTYKVGVGNELLGCRRERDDLRREVAALKTQIGGAGIAVDLRALFAMLRKLEASVGQE